MNIEKIMRTLLKPWAVGLIFFIYGLLIYFVDEPLAIYLHQLHLENNCPSLNFATNFGDKNYVAVLLLLPPLFFRYLWLVKRYELSAWFVWFCVVFANGVAVVLKLILGKARPILLFKENLYGFYGFHLNKYYWSLPSGHVVTNMSMMFALMILFPRFRVLFWLVGLSMMATRVLLTYHYISDVFMTAYLSWFLVGSVYFALRRLRKHSLDFMQYKVSNE